MNGKPLISYDATRSPKKPKGRQERFKELKDEGLRAYVRQQACLIGLRAACRGAVEVAHVKSKGAAGGDWDNLVPLCAYHHSQQHILGRRSFEYRYDFRLGFWAKHLTAAYLREKGL